MTWTERVAQQWSGGKFDACEVNHGIHDTVLVDASFAGRPMPMEVFAWETYANTTGYCCGDDDVSKSIAVSGEYERPETAILNDLFWSDPPPDVDSIVIDLGAHVGWYTIAAAIAGYHVIAVDADTEHLRVLERNARLHNVRDLVTPVRGWIGPETPEIEVPVPARSIRLLKADLESLENEAVRICYPLFGEQLIDFALIEISPVMADHYATTIETVMNCGYNAYVVPGSADNVYEKLYSDQLSLDGLHERVASWHQHNVLFARDNLT